MANKRLSPKKEIYRGDIMYADLGQHVKSSVQSGERPCVVVSNNINNKNSTVIVVCPCTTKLKKTHMPTHIKISKDDVRGYMSSDSLLLAEQITVISKHKVLFKMGHIPNDSLVMNEINGAIKRQLAV